MHAAPPLGKSPLISSYSSNKCLAKIGVAYFTKWFAIYFYCWWMEDVSFQSPLVSPSIAYCWVLFRLSKPNIVCLIAFPTSIKLPRRIPSQLEKISRYPKENQPEVLLNTYAYTNLAYNAISAYLIIWWPGPYLRRRPRPPGKTFSPTEKMSWTYCMRNHCLRTCYRCKIWAYLRKFFAPPGIPNYGYGSAGECCLMTTVSFATQLSLFPIKFLRLTSNFNRRSIMSKVLF